jgi:hypothetical protein
MHYMANGQRVPEDLHPINVDYLLHRALKPAEQKTAFTLNELDFPMLMSAEGSLRTPVKGIPPDVRHSVASGSVLLAGAAESKMSSEAYHAL